MIIASAQPAKILTSSKIGLGPVARSSESRKDDVRVSYEFFPPKNRAMEKTLWSTLHQLERYNPDFVSVTYGAGGTTRNRTIDTVTRIVNETGLKPAAHLTCVGARREAIDDIARELWNGGVRHIVALRGDPPGGVDKNYVPTHGGYAYGSDLVAGLKTVADFDVSVSAYPERHPESANWDAELDCLKRKIDAGATRAITQFFFEADTFLRFRDRAAASGIAIPLIPGIMLQPNFEGLVRMAAMCGVTVPRWYTGLFEGTEKDLEARKILTGALAMELTASLLEQGVRHFHLYTLNKADIAISISKMLGVKAGSSGKAVAL